MRDSDNARPHWNKVWFGDRPDAIRYWLIGCGQRRLEGNFSDVVAGLVDVSLNDFAFLIDDTDEATALFQRDRCIEGDAVFGERDNATGIAFAGTIFVLDQNGFARHQERGVQARGKGDHV
ncbi:hypothetical protein OFC46_11355 [Escherichia coli]|nr:hypothetical protein [Escherichia coli]